MTMNGSCWAACLTTVCLLSILSCQADTQPAHPGAVNDGGNDGAVSTCGTSSANSMCESVTWPRIAVAFGDSSAATFSYVFDADDGFASSDRNPCPSGYGESTALHCDIAFFANPNERAVSLSIAGADGGAVLLARDISLMPFSNCGVGIAQVVATTTDAGMPELSAVQYVTACGMP